MNSIKLIECPRDAMQGINDFIPTETKAEYINQLLSVGFDTIDFGSFVSPKAIPQLRDTSEVLSMLKLENTSSKLLSIVANKRGAEAACSFQEIDFLGFPFSISETFQQRNTNSSIEQSLGRVEEIKNLTVKHNKELVVYLSMAFGNPYGDKWDTDVAAEWTEKLARQLEVKIIALSDTIGVSNEQNITALFTSLIPEFPEVEFGAHLHTTPDTWKEKMEAAFSSGCIRFDSAVKGYGGCPMADDVLTGNMATENLINFMKEKDVALNISESNFQEALLASQKVFS